MGLPRRKIVRIDSDGDPRNTQVTFDDGSKLDNVRQITIDLEAESIPVVRIEVWGEIATGVTGFKDVVTLICPMCGTHDRHSCDALLTLGTRPTLVDGDGS